MVRGPYQKDDVLWLQFADQAAPLLDQLDVVLRLKTGISGKETVHFVDEDDRRAVLLRAGEQIGELFHRSARGASENVGRRNRIEASLGLGGNEAGDHRLAGARGTATLCYSSLRH